MPEEKIGRYLVKSELGRGGMATVFHAYDPSFERDVAIKVLPPAFLHDAQLRTRFEREAKMIALLEHPAIVPVYDFGDDNGQPYIVMRYMAGGSLADRLKSGAIGLEETARIISRLAPALDAAHARGIIHRDIKPGNVLFDQYGNAFLSDFGIARQGQTSSVTITGENIIGTPAYMSPEQVQGDRAMDGRSDIYAMGVLVFQMLTGQAPYQADTPAKVMLMHILEPVPNLLDKKHNLPPGSQEIIAHAMAKDPNERYATTTELSSDLELVAHGGETRQSNKTAVPDRTMVSGQTVISSGKTSLSAARGPVQPAAGSGSYAPAVKQPAIQAAQPSGKPTWMIWAGLALVLLLVGGSVIAGLIYLVGQNSQMLSILSPGSPTSAPLPSATSAPPSPTVIQSTATSIPVVVLDTPVPPTPTQEIPTQTITPTATLAPPVAGPILGGADKIAYITGGNIWAANLDGSDLVQLTTDGTVKTSLQWTPDGTGVSYITGKCVQIAYLETGEVDNIVCFNFIDSLKFFSISPDNKLAALTLDNQMYIVPFDIPTLQQISDRTDLTDMAACKEFAPYKKNFITQVRWSNDSSTLAAKLIANLGDGRQGDIIQLFNVSSCVPNPRAIDNFPPPRFTFPGYEKNPVIQNYSWDGVFLFALTSIIRNDGYGDLYVYNTDLHKAYYEINPINDVCCYRDPQWSPDGSYLAFAYQNYLGGSSSTTQIYYIPYASLGTGAQYKPLALPEIVDPRERPQPVLRAVK